MRRRQPQTTTHTRPHPRQRLDHHHTRLTSRNKAESSGLSRAKPPEEHRKVRSHCLSQTTYAQPRPPAERANPETPLLSSLLGEQHVQKFETARCGNVLVVDKQSEVTVEAKAARLQRE